MSPDELKAAILLFYGLPDEQQRRLFADLESLRLGHGGKNAGLGPETSYIVIQNHTGVLSFKEISVEPLH